VGDAQHFNVAKDPGEASDLSELMPEKLEMLKNAWNQYAKDVGVVPRESSV
jgi:arylsulfatase